MNLKEMSTSDLKSLKQSLEKKVDALDNEQMAFKILINSAYGAIGSPYFRFFNVIQASAITISGQTTIRTAEQALNTYLSKLLGEKDRVCAIDTDSTYLILDDLIDKFCPDKSIEDQVEFVDKVCETKLSAVIDKAYNDLYNDTNSMFNRMRMKRENIGPAVFVQKKRYIMKVYDSEGVRYAKPKMKVMGLESVRSTTPGFFRDKLKEVFYELFDMNQEQMFVHIENIRKEFMKLPVEDMGSPIGVQNLGKYRNSTGTVPYNAKAALLYNDKIDSMSLAGRYQHIKDGDKVKLLPLKTPNHFKAKYIAVESVLPVEFKLHKYVDKDAIFNKFFADPLQRVFDTFNWKTEETASLDSFFG